jgi:hypothetical protein
MKGRYTSPKIKDILYIGKNTDIMEEKQKTCFHYMEEKQVDGIQMNRNNELAFTISI